DTVMIDLAQQVVRDGEGAGKFVTIAVTGAATAAAARRIGLTIGNSPLVKTAFSAGDPNWGRIVMAVGRAGERVDSDRLTIAIGGIQIAAGGGPVPRYEGAPVPEHMKGRGVRFPGGKVNPAETPEAALIRELAEELGIDVAASCLAPLTFASYSYPDFHLLMPLYVCRKWSGIPVAREGQRLSWVRPTQLGDYPIPPADKPLIAMLRDLL